MEGTLTRPLLIDTHIHLDAAEFDPDREFLIGEARQAGVGGFVVPGVSREGFDAVQALARRHPDIQCALGLHPMYVDQAGDDDLDVLRGRLAQGGVVAVGEIGLDGWITPRDDARQLHFFVAQLRLAREFGLPVILHVRRAIDPILKQLRGIEVPGGIAHAFNGSRQQADTLLAMGFKLGFGGTLSYEGSRRIRALATELPETALVLETDAPDIAPSWSADRRTRPADLARYARLLAELRGVPLQHLAECTTHNARQALPGLKTVDTQPAGESSQS